jgi:hypothetical protein
MIGAIDAADALRQARRSVLYPDGVRAENLQAWNGIRYAPLLNLSAYYARKRAAFHILGV